METDDEEDAGDVASVNDADDDIGSDDTESDEE